MNNIENNGESNLHSCKNELNKENNTELTIENFKNMFESLLLGFEESITKSISNELSGFEESITKSISNELSGFEERFTKRLSGFEENFTKRLSGFEESFTRFEEKFNSRISRLESETRSRYYDMKILTYRNNISSSSGYVSTREAMGRSPTKRGYVNYNGIASSSLVSGGGGRSPRKLVNSYDTFR